MSQIKIDKLTPEQEALIPVYRQKWRAIALSTEPIDRQKAAEAIKAVYASLDETTPIIHFFDSPFTAGEYILSNLVEYLMNQFAKPPKSALEMLLALLEKQLAKPLVSEFAKAIEKLTLPPLVEPLTLDLDYLLSQEVCCKLQEELETPMQEERTLLKNELASHLCDKIDTLKNHKQFEIQISDKLKSQPKTSLKSYLGNLLYQQFWEDVKTYLWQDINNFIFPKFLIFKIAFYDILISEFNCQYNQEKWLLSQSIVKHCGWIFPFEKICIVCDRPRILSFDSEQRLHAEGEPALQFADGYSLYSYHGVTLPEEYGKLHPSQWQPHWLLKEDNAELRRVLIQGIGYSRICQELQATELDSWQEYTLLRIDNDVDEEPIYLLKMTCPSTGHIHALRVPPNMKSAREAIRWVNWGIDPEEFSVQT